MLRSTVLLLSLVASSAFMTAPMGGLRLVSRAGRASAVSFRMSETTPAPEPTPAAQEEAPAAPAPKKAAAPAKEAGAGATVGFSGVPSAFARPGQTSFGSESGQTFLGMNGPRSAGHREKFGGRHAAVSLALATLMFQPILQAGNYGLPSKAGEAYTKTSFDAALSAKAPGFAKVPTLDAFLPFAKNGFTTGPALFSEKSPIVFETKLLGGCGAYGNKEGTCHTFFDEIGDLVTKKPETPARGPVKPSYFTPWVYKK